MLNLKKISAIALTVSAFAMPEPVFAQNNSHTLQGAQPVQLPAEKAGRATPKLISSRKAVRSLKRVVINPVPKQASADQLQKRYAFEGVIDAAADGPNKPTRFIYNRAQDSSQSCVLFEEASLNAR